MFIFRFEHVCPLRHGPVRITYSCPLTLDPYDDAGRPEFGHRGSPPADIDDHERCAVTALQFEEWWGNYWYEGSRKPNPDYDNTQWELIAYWVEDDQKGHNWHYDNGQVVFDPTGAVNMGPVTIDEVLAMRDEEDALRRVDARRRWTPEYYAGLAA